MSWWSAAPTAALAVGVLLVPGVVIAAALGLRRIPALAIAPFITVAVIVVSAVVAGVTGVPWGPPVLLGVVLLLAAGARVSRRAPQVPVPKHRPPVAVALGVGLVITMASLGHRLVRALGSPDAIAQSYDSVFHYSAVREILATGDASSLELAQLVRPGQSPALYPGGWHAVVALVARATPDQIPLASNMVVLGVSLVVWPLGCVLLAQVTLGARFFVISGAGALAGLFAMFPLLPLSRGLMYPHFLSVALLPIAVALCVVASGHAASRDEEAIDGLSRRRAVLLLICCSPGLALSHPSTVVGLGVLTAPLALSWALRTVRGIRSRRRAVVTVIALTVVASTLVAAVVLLPLLSATVQSVQQYALPVRVDVPAALWSASTGSQINRPPAPMTSLLVIAGGVLMAIRRRRNAAAPQWWAAVSYLLAAGLFVLATADRSAFSVAITGYWYNHDVRLAAMMPVLGVLLATAALAAAMDAVAARVGRHSLVTATAVLVVVAVLAQDASLRTGHYMMARRHLMTDDQRQSLLLTVDERALIDRIPATVPPGVTVAGHPADGSALIYALANRPVVFPALSGAWDEPRRVLATSMNRIATSPEVCAAARALDVQYAVDLGDTLEGRPREQDYPGMTGFDTAPGFTLVDQQGSARLYRVSCEESG